MSQTSTMTFNRVAYEALDVCNGVEMAVVEAAVARTGLGPGARMVDVGTGNAAVPLRLASRFGFDAVAIEYDPLMAGLARERIAAAGMEERVVLAVGAAAEMLSDRSAVDLITALGTTNVNGEGRPAPTEALAFLKRRLKPGGWLLWGDLVWLSEPPAPLRQIAEATNQYADDAGWKAAAQAAGFDVVWSEISSQAVFDAYAGAADAAARAWLDAYPDAPGAAPVRTSADRVKAVFDFGRDFIGFGLYLLRA